METETLNAAAARLADPSEETRYRAVSELCRLNRIGALPLLMTATADASYRVREAALLGICSFPPDHVFPRLEAYLRDHENADLRTAALEAIPRYGKQATAFLLSLLRDDDEEVRNFAAVMLGEVRNPDTVAGLIESLRDPEENVRHAAAESLGRIGDARAVAPLTRCLQEDFWVRYPAVIALGQIGDPQAAPELLPLLDDELLRPAVVEALGQLGDPTVLPVLAELLARPDTASIRNETIAAIIRIQGRARREPAEAEACLPLIQRSLRSEDLISHLRNSLHEPELAVRKNAVIALGWLREERATPALINLLTDYELEEYVDGALVAIGAPAVPALARELANPDPKLRVALLRCLGWIEDPAGLRACLPCLSDPCLEVRGQAVIALLGALETEEVEDALVQMLADPEPELHGLLIETLAKSRSPRLPLKLLPLLDASAPAPKLAAVKVLGRLHCGAARGPLQARLEDESDEVRAEVYKALAGARPGGLTPASIHAGLADPSPRVRKVLAACLPAMPAETRDGALLRLLHDADPEVRVTAVRVMGKLESPEAARDLMGLFPGADPRLRIAILQVLGTLPDRSSLAFLTEAQKDGDPDLKRAAIASLGQLGDARALPHLVAALDDADWSVRAAAVTALGRLGDQRCQLHLIARLEDEEDMVKKEAINALAEIGAKGAACFVLPLLHNDNLQPEAIKALEKLGVDDWAGFFDFFHQSNSRLKCRLTGVLGRLAGTEPLEYLVRILGNEFFTVRARAARALGERSDPRAIASLLKTQKEDPSEEVRKEATLALKKLSSR